MSSLPITDEQLVEIIRSVDQERYTQIISRYQQKLDRYLRRFVIDPDERQDILQTVFIKAFKNLYNFNTRKKFSSWIYRIAHNEAINHIKKKANQTVTLDDNEFQVIDEKINLPREVDQGLLKDKISLHLGQLKLKYRQPLILFYFEQKSYEEISYILRIPKNTVGTLISRGKIKLRELIEKDFNFVGFE